MDRVKIKLTMADSCMMNYASYTIVSSLFVREREREGKKDLLMLTGGQNWPINMCVNVGQLKLSILI